MTAKLVLILLFLASGISTRAAGILDTLSFGQAPSETAHALAAANSDTVTGLLGEPARRLLAVSEGNWQGGQMAFTMKVDPAQPTYFTIRLSGSDRNENLLILFCEGKQIGYRYLGDVDILDSPNGEPACNGRFYYTTCPLPLTLTKGKSELHFEIRSTGSIFGYSNAFATYQHAFQGATRGIYRVYTHTDGCFLPPADEKQGALPNPIPVRSSPGPEVLQAARDRVNSQVSSLLQSKEPLNQLQLWFLARAHAAGVKQDLTRKATDALDHLFLAYRQNPKIAQAEPSMYNGDWFGLGPAAQSVLLLGDILTPLLDQDIQGAPGITRRAGWAQMFAASRDWHRENRRQYTNQTMISDTYGIYLANRGVAALDPGKALPETQTLRYLYQSVGLLPWTGSEKNGTPTAPLGGRYYQVTARGLTKELGFVGYYGEVLDWMASMYEATRPGPGQPGDPGLLEQYIKIAKARAAFRYPALDDEGNRAMRVETVIGWRDQNHYPGNVAYTERPTWDASILSAAAVTADPSLIGYVQQMFADNQFLAGVAEMLKTGGLRATAGMLNLDRDEAFLQRLPPSGVRLPMSDDQPNFTWADEDDGVLALKHGDKRLYVSLYWRARYSINYLARVHSITPTMDRIAVVHEDEQFNPSGQFWTRPDWVDAEYANGGVPYPGDLHSALTGEQLPIAKSPPSAPFHPGEESPYAGRASFYQLRYGPYLIGMNASDDRTFSLALPPGADSALDLVSGTKVSLRQFSGSMPVPAHTTAVLYLGQDR